jgi:hypothetical protein
MGKMSMDGRDACVERLDGLRKDFEDRQLPGVDQNQQPCRLRVQRQQPRDWEREETQAD